LLNGRRLEHKCGLVKGTELLGELTRRRVKTTVAECIFEDGDSDEDDDDDDDCWTR
jgi:hypothetical protein